MSKEINITDSLSREEKYKSLIPQIVALTTGETSFIANTANVTAALKQAFEDFLWVGFYFSDDLKINNIDMFMNCGEAGRGKSSNRQLILGPFQGRIACTRIRFGEGVCGTAAVKKETIIVGDVDKFPGHIVCDSLSKSEIVVPVIKNGILTGVLDIDSDKYANFNETDKKYLEELVVKISYIF